MIPLLHKYSKSAAMVATQVFNDKPLGLVSNFALRLFHVAILLSLWRTVMADEGAVAGMSLEAVQTYTLIAAVFNAQLSGRTRIDDDLWSGKIANRLLRPMGIYGQILAEMVGGWIPDLLLFSLPLLLAAPLLGVDPWPATWMAGLWFAVSLTFAIAVGTALDLFFAACMVFLEHSIYALQRIRTALTLLLSGRLIPLALLPWGLGEYLELLPFASLVSAPLRIYTGTGDPHDLVPLQAAWAVVLWVAAHALWRHNRERLVTHGG
jgi:ABC-2 type transport system permease protein